MPPFHANVVKLFRRLRSPQGPPHHRLTIRDASTSPFPKTPLLQTPWQFPIWGYITGTACVLAVCIIFASICSGLHRRIEQKQKAQLLQLEDGRPLISTTAEEGAEQLKPSSWTNANWSTETAAATGAPEAGDEVVVTRPKKAMLVQARLKARGRGVKVDVRELCSALRNPGLKGRQARREEKGKYRATSPSTRSGSGSESGSELNGNTDAGLGTRMRRTRTSAAVVVMGERGMLVVEPEKPVGLELEEDVGKPSPGELVAKGVGVRDFAFAAPLHFGMEDAGIGNGRFGRRNSSTYLSGRMEAGPSNSKELKRPDAVMLRDVASVSAPDA